MQITINSKDDYADSNGQFHPLHELLSQALETLNQRFPGWEWDGEVEE